MTTDARELSSPTHPWTWPVDIAGYDCSPELSAAERTELKRIMRHKPLHLHPSTKAILHRLLQPLEDVFVQTHMSRNIWYEVVRVMVVEMAHRGKSFWAWSEAEWLDIIGPSYEGFARRYRRSYGGGRQHPARRELPVLTYLLCSPRILDPLLAPFAIAPIARKVFGTERIDSQVKRLSAALSAWGITKKTTMTSSLASAISCCATRALSWKPSTSICSKR